MRRAALATALTATLVAGCGGGDDEAKVCASDAGSTACLVDGSGGGSVKLEAEGFQPGSEIAVAGLNSGDDQLGRVAKIAGNGKPEAAIGYVDPSGRIPEMVVTVQGTSKSGAPVLLTIRRPAT